MRLEPLDPKGIHPREKTGVAALRRGLSGKWFGFLNLSLRAQTIGDQPSEIDAIIVTHDRVFMIDLKDWPGHITSNGGTWLQDGRHMERSAALKIIENAKILSSHLRREFSKFQTSPYVEPCVVFTHPRSDIRGIRAEEQGKVYLLATFIDILTDRTKYDARFKNASAFGYGRPLFESPYRDHLATFMRGGKILTPQQIVFSDYRPEAHPTFVHPENIYSEFLCERVDDSNLTALLRYWDFQELNDASGLVEADRRNIATREQAVLGYLNVNAPELYSEGVLKSKDHDHQYQVNYWELFELRRSTQRIYEHLLIKDPPLERRLQIASLFLGRLASLHRHSVAHRDLGHHSIWFEDDTSRLLFSALGTSYYPERGTLGTARTQLSADKIKLPEHESKHPPMPFSEDVFRAGVIVWKILTNLEIASLDGIPVWAGSDFDQIDRLPDGLRSWFETALEYEPAKRFADAVEMHDAYIAATRRPEYKEALRQLALYESDKNPHFKYPIKKEFDSRNEAWLSEVNGVSLLIKHWSHAITRDSSSWPRVLRFLDIAAELRREAPNWMPRLIEAAHYKSALFSAQFVENAVTLEETTLRRDNNGLAAYQFLAALVRAISELHDLKIAHGDLKPENILVKPDAGSFVPLLVDLPDFATAEEGELFTPAYSPPKGPTDSYTRDRYALCKIIEDNLSNYGAEQICEEASVLLNAARACAAGDYPWSGLIPLTSAISRTTEKRKSLSITFDIPVIYVDSKQRIVSDGGFFHVVLENNTIRLFGALEEVRILIDPTTKIPTRAYTYTFNARTLAWAQSSQAFEFEGTVFIHQGKTCTTADVAWLVEHPKVTGHFSASTSHLEAVTSQVQMVAESRTFAPATSVAGLVQEPAEHKELEISRTTMREIWETGIAVESDTLAELNITGPAVFDKARRVHIIPIESGLPDFERDEKVLLFLDGAQIGKVDRPSTTPEALAVRDLVRSFAIKPGTTLQLQTLRDRIQLEKRRTAAARVLADLCEIPQLADYFESTALLSPTIITSVVPTLEDLSIYELNAVQKDAFMHLWTHGPVGLLQGPPGTGKTTFIASFLHYALTRGGLSNVLLVSQSNEAVNTAAQRVLRLNRRLNSQITMVRIGDALSISPELMSCHADFIQDSHRELFKAEAKTRIIHAASQLALPPEFTIAAFEFRARLEPIVLELTSNYAAANDESGTSHRTSLISAYQSLLEPFNVVADVEPGLAFTYVLDALAKDFGITNRSSVAKLNRLFDLSFEWTRALSGERSIDEFLALSRNILCGTCLGVARTNLSIDKRTFDLVVIDEAAKCNPGELAVAMQSAKRILLVGDHKQIQPFYRREHMIELLRRLGTTRLESDFERAFKSPYGKSVGRTLTQQYRMAPDIGQLIADCFYEEEGLQTAPDRLPTPDFYEMLPSPLDQPLLWLDTSPLGDRGYEEPVGFSARNLSEVATILGLIRRVASEHKFWARFDAQAVQQGPAIGVICMYGAQRDAINRALVTSGLSESILSRIKVSTVDGFQGQESAFIIVSLTKNNRFKRVGDFAKDLTRMNVALSRAMERLIIVGSVQMFDVPGDAFHLTRVANSFRTHISGNRIVSAEIVLG
jgi:serine/threonine protein kinase